MTCEGSNLASPCNTAAMASRNCSSTSSIRESKSLSAALRLRAPEKRFSARLKRNMAVPVSAGRSTYSGRCCSLSLEKTTIEKSQRCRNASPEFDHLAGDRKHPSRNGEVERLRTAFLLRLRLLVYEGAPNCSVNASCLTPNVV